jgi:pimeloyl-ACP methyl ester carboxylesterase
MLEHEQARREQQNETIDVSQSAEPAATVEAQVQPQAPVPRPAHEEQTGAPAVEAQGPQAETAVTPQKAPADGVTDTAVEQLAHGMVDKEIDDRDELYLAEQGFRAMPIIRGQREFVMRTFLPTAGGKPPIVAFRGTVPSKVQTLIADVDPSGIGMYQFNPNRALIEGQIQAASSHGKIISAGHSLGGALAQIAASTFPDAIDRIVTFQAPGVSREVAEKLKQHNEENPDEAIESSHHRVSGDLVPMGGEALTPGTVHNHEMSGGSWMSRNALSKHLAFPLAQEAAMQGQDLPNRGGSHDMTHTGDVSTEQDNAEKSQLIEHARTGLGHLIFGTGALINGAGNLIKKAFD